MNNERPFRVDALLFDLDGTLVDSAPDIARAANNMLRKLTMPTVDTASIRRWVGNGAVNLVKRALTGHHDGEPDLVLLERAMPLFFEFYQSEVCVESVFYEGVPETLFSLNEKGFKMACVTNKPSRHTQSLLEKMNIDHLFSVIVAGDSLPQRKPDPTQLISACQQLGVSTEMSIMVGDSPNDIIAAKAVPMPVLCMTYGYNQGTDLSTLQPDVLLDQFKQISGLVAR